MTSQFRRVAPVSAALLLLPAFVLAAPRPSHLAGATSPYLRQHLDNPVDWYPWGDEALRRARAAARADVPAARTASPAPPAPPRAEERVVQGVIVGRANRERVVEGAVVPPDRPVRPGQAVTLSLDLAIAPGWHVNSNTPTLPYLIPTALILPSHEQAIVDSIDYPPGALVALEFAREKLSVYEGTTTIRINLRPAVDGPSGTRTIALRVGYQACSHKVCLPPETQEFAVPVRVEGDPVAIVRPPGRAGEAAAGGGREGDAPDGSVLAGGESIAALLARRGLLALFGVVFLAGLALDLTPCVYPLVPVTLSFFAGQAAASWGRRVALPSLYVLGMALTYSALGLLAGLSGTMFGSTLQSPWVVGALVLLFVAMALGMFGCFEFRLPGFMTRVGGGRRGLAGALVMGLTMGIVAAPCIGPFVVGLLAFVGASGQPILGFWLFFVLALGMGLPFLALGVFSGALASLPRSGQWLIYAKKLMGVGLLAVALYFLQPFLSDRTVGWIALGFSAAAGIYLALLEGTRMSNRWFLWVKTAAGILVALAGVSIALPLVQARPEAAWRPYTPEAYERARRDGHPLVIDFFAEWCLPCKELDRYTFSDPRVIEALRPFALLKADLTQFESVEVRAVRDRFEVIGVPTIVFVDEGGNERRVLRLYGFEEVPDFLARLAKVRSTRDAAP